MDQLIQAFGVDVKLITVQILNFAILLGLLSYFLYKPVLKVLADREEKIAQGIKDAEAAAAARATAAAEKQAIVATAHVEAEEVSKRAKGSAEEFSAEIIAAANAKAEQLLKEAVQRGETLQARLQKESEAEVAKLAILAAEKVMRQNA